MDWSVGHYESTAEQLSPVATAIVDRAGISAGDRVVDIGCGTGNAALAAALFGARVVGVDPRGAVARSGARVAVADARHYGAAAQGAETALELSGPPQFVQYMGVASVPRVRRTVVCVQWRGIVDTFRTFR